jgi:hypothetical protein
LRNAEFGRISAARRWRRGSTAVAVGCLAALLAAATVGCTAAKRPAVTLVDIPPPASAPAAPPDVFARGQELLAGFEAPATDDAWRVGDQLVCGIESSRDGKREVRFARITVRTLPLAVGQKVEVGDAPAADQRRPDTIYLPHPDPKVAADRQRVFAGVNWRLAFAVRSPAGEQRDVSYESALLLLSIELFDENLKRISVAHATAPEACLRRGLYELTGELIALRGRLGPNIREIMRTDPSRFDIPVHRLADIIATLFALRDTLWSAPSLGPMLESMVEKPSLWSILVKRGIHFSLHPRWEDVDVETRPLPALAGGRQARVLPFDVQINGKLATTIQLSVAEAKPPVQVSAGIVGVDVTHPSDKDRWLRLRVLSARRGAPVAASGPVVLR